MTNTFATDASLQAIRINDFSPGIVNYGRGTQPSTLAPFAPLGSASSAFRCVARRGVGLVPLPSHSLARNLAPAGAVYATPTVPTLCTAIKAIGGIVPTGSTHLPQVAEFSDVVYVAVNYQTDASNRQTEVHRYLSNTATDSVIWTLPVDATIDAAHGFAMSITRVLNSAGETAVPTVAMAQSFKRVYRMAPDPVSYTGGASNDISGDYTVNTNTLAGVQCMVTHEFRILFFCSLFFTLGTASQYFTYVDDFFYTDPPQSSTVHVPPAGNAPAFFDPEDYSSVGAFGSINSGELMVIRQGQGGFMISGDIQDPSITKLPGVRGTGRLMQQAATTPLGLIYLSELDGAWNWNGSNVAQKISTQIPDDALQRTPTLATATPPYALDGVNAYNEVWGPWCLFSHNWLYDTDLQSWWRLEDPAVIDFECYSRANQNNRICWAIPGQGNPLPLHFLDRRTMAYSYTWTSNPITPYLGAYTNILYVEILASNPSPNSGSIQVTGISQTGYDSAPVTFTIPANSTVRLSSRLGYNSPDPQIQVFSTNVNAGSPAPTLHEIDLGCQRAAPAGLS